MSDTFEAHAPEGPLHRPVGAREDAVPAALEVVEENAPVQGLGGATLEPHPEHLGDGALGTEAHCVSAVEELEGWPARGVANSPAEVPGGPRPVLYRDRARGGERAPVRDLVERRVPKNVDLRTFGQREVVVHPNPPGRVVVPWEVPDRRRDLDARRPDAG